MSHPRHHSRFVALIALVVAFVATGCVDGPGDRSAADDSATDVTPLRVAQFNIWELSREKVDEVDAEGRGTHAQLVAAAEILRRVSPDIVVVNEVDVVQEGPDPLTRVWRDFEARYLNDDDDAAAYPYVFAAPVNTGVLSGFDLNNDGVVATEADRGTRSYGDDSLGYGEYPGQYGMIIASRIPLDLRGARTFRTFLWRDMPGNAMPEGWYTPEEDAVVRLSSKTHMAVPMTVGGRTIHLVAAHPTPPGFDGAEDRNGRRNRDEVRLIVDLIDGADYLVDDDGVSGGLPQGESFVIMGDLNASRRGSDPGPDHPIRTLLNHPRVQDTGDVCVSEGGLAGREPGPPAYFERSTTGRATGLRIDYVLPSTGLEVTGGGVHFPAAEADPAGAERAAAASDHRLVWVDLEVGGP